MDWGLEMVEVKLAGRESFLESRKGRSRCPERGSSSRAQRKGPCCLRDKAALSLPSGHSAVVSFLRKPCMFGQGLQKHSCFSALRKLLGPTQSQQVKGKEEASQMEIFNFPSGQERADTQCPLEQKKPKGRGHPVPSRGPRHPTVQALPWLVAHTFYPSIWK